MAPCSTGTTRHLIAISRYGSTLAAAKEIVMGLAGGNVAPQFLNRVSNVLHDATLRVRYQTQAVRIRSGEHKS